MFLFDNCEYKHIYKYRKAFCYYEAMMLLFNIYEYDFVILCPYREIRILKKRNNQQLLSINIIKLKKALCHNKAMILLFNIYEYECVILYSCEGIRIF